MVGVFSKWTEYFYPFTSQYNYRIGVTSVKPISQQTGTHHLISKKKAKID